MKTIFTLLVVAALGACANTAGTPHSLGKTVFHACLEENNYQAWSQTAQASRIHLHCKRLANSYADGYAQSLAQVD